MHRAHSQCGGCGVFPVHGQIDPDMVDLEAFQQAAQNLAAGAHPGEHPVYGFLQGFFRFFRSFLLWRGLVRLALRRLGGDFSGLPAAG